MGKKTPLFEQHHLAGARLIDFNGWEMPVSYGSLLHEHHQVRHDAGMFDVSHMTVVDLLGASGRQCLRYLLANDVDKLTHSGRALYSCMLNHQGGIIDDLIVYYRSPDNYRLVLNSATRVKDLAWIRDKTNELCTGLQERDDLAMLAIQGPQAITKILQIATPAQADAIATLQPFEGVDVQDWFIGRTGYTGEDGLEIILPKEAIATLWKNLLTVGVKPCGLGARDTLRLEAGMMLYGQDMDETTSPLESALEWTVTFAPQDRDFIGRSALTAQKLQLPKRKLVGLILQGNGVMRAGQKVLVPDIGEGVITSGSYSPTLQKSIAYARVPYETLQQCMVEIRGKMIPAQVTKPRFVRNGKAI